jgi:hypothetical protein
VTFDNRFAVWRNPIIDLWVPAGTQHRRVFFAKGPEFGWAAEMHEIPLCLDSFTIGPSDYEMPSDELYCPCGAVIRDWGDSAGELLREIYKHCGAAGHPRPIFER